MLTLQLGHYSNHVAAHYWNVQQAEFERELSDCAAEHRAQRLHELFADAALWRTNADGGFSPRALIFDARGALGSLSASTGQHVNAQAVAATVRAASSSSSSLEVFDCSAERPSAFYSALSTAEHQPAADLPDDVTSWTDYCSFQLASRNIYELPDLTHEIDAFDCHSQGGDVMRKLEQRDDIVDAVRRLAEDCDRLLGFQSFVDVDGGYGGFAVDLFDELRNQYGNVRPLIVHAVSPPPPPEPTPRARRLFDLNAASCLGRLHDTASLYAPMGFDPAALPDDQQRLFAAVRCQRPYHSSAVLALAADALSLPCRRPPRVAHADFVAALRPLKVVGVAAGWCPPAQRSAPALASLWSHFTYDQQRTSALSFAHVTVCRQLAPFEPPPPPPPPVPPRSVSVHPPLPLHRTFPAAALSPPATDQLAGVVQAVASPDVCAAVRSVAARLKQPDGRLLRHSEFDDLQELYNNLLLITETDSF